jgi:phenylpyruvate tautomerase PptA (4-oxalocrotonate tautomerase family)
MPLVRIDLRRNPDPDFARRAGEVIYAAMRSTINVPEHDHFQVLTEHDASHLIYDAQYLGIARTEGFLSVQITLNEGRTLEQKKLLYRSIADGLHERLGVRLEDVFINLIEVKKENWSFGNGVAQYAS